MLPRHHHEFFLRSRPYRGEPPTVAGFLLYPDTPASMETTSQEAFCFRPVTQQLRDKGLTSYLNPDNDRVTQNTHLELNYPTSSRQTRTGNGHKDREVGGDEQECNQDHTKPTAMKNGITEMQSQYQKDFHPPASCCRRRTPAFPQPDNIGINPAFRIEFSTVQRETYSGWPNMSPSRPADTIKHDI
ncbi:uncharacterized protein si:dkeyp-69c1.9 isoform X1 [Mugil cephalus]|uniref:uncharacterized protein si:dkeyp-69c1.9 isoform X1 n=1 Tax=Mugil cephalus TaxID=48193 RepID=UPI001FB69E1C|nr:uncharacterized protein si:dkeyp-69c1.9 isoform X1 [Mugil cephalus]XP_047463847.1 uncharacterized protein si:dkeyp-69c1.9 isoform X1 [Mugil cephalus]